MIKIQRWNGSGFVYSEVKKADQADNADKLDLHDAGNLPNEVLVLDNSGKVPLANLPDELPIKINLGSIDGGGASSVFTPSQSVNGGDVNG